MTVQELKEHCRKTIDSQMAFKNHPDDMGKFFYNKQVLEEHQLILNVIEAWEKVKAELTARIPKFPLTDYADGYGVAMECAIDIIKKHLGEVEG